MKTSKINLLIIMIAMLFNNRVNAQDKALSVSVNIMINNYLALKNALITGDGASGELKAKTLLASIADISKTGLTANEADLIPKLEFDSRHISEVNNISHQREHFASLSNNLYNLLKALKVNNTVLYRQYCTMNKRYFLSETEKSKDPYMGMANCSKVTETLPAATGRKQNN